MSEPLSLTEKHRPHTLDEVRGQPEAVGALRSFLRQPYPAAFLLCGPSGTGKTTAARALAFHLGCACDYGAAGGLFEVPSGKQDGLAVSALLDALRTRPLLGSGWRVAVVNEADRMTRAAEAIWLDGLEALPRQVVVALTTNAPDTLSGRLIGRCEVLRFSGSPCDVAADLEAHVREVWLSETGRTLGLLPEGIGRTDPMSDELSFRLALQQIAPYARSGADLPARFEPPLAPEKGAADREAKRLAGSRSDAGRKAAETKRRKAGQQRRQAS